MAESLSTEQEWAVGEMMRSTRGGVGTAKRGVMLYGEAGTGKSRVLRTLVARWRASGLNVVVLALSNMVARMYEDGMTIHSFSGMAVDRDPDSSRKRARAVTAMEEGARTALESRLAKKRARMQRTDCIAIDEISMVSARVLDVLDHIMRTARNCARPFGGVRVVLAGDPLQVCPSDGNGYFDDAAAWRALNVRILALTEMHRQQNPAFAAALSRIRVGDTGPVTYLNQRRVVAPPGVTRLVPYRAEAERINVACTKRLGTEHVRFDAQDFRDPRYKGPHVDFETATGLPNSVTIYVGAMVRLLANVDPDPDADLPGAARGQIGIVRGFDPETRGFVHLEMANATHLMVGRVQMSIRNESGDVGARCAMPLAVAFAMTYHLAQGLTLPFLSLDPRAWGAGMLYVALSRVGSLAALYLTSDILPESVKVDAHALAFGRRKDIEFFSRAPPHRVQ